MFLNENHYEPIEPYIFKSGKNEGKYAEKVFFDNPYFIFYIYNNFIQNYQNQNNEFQKHMKWIVDRANSLNPTMLCTHCQKNPVRFFATNFSYNDSEHNSVQEGLRYSFCNNSKCKDKVRTLPTAQISTVYPIKYFVLDKISTANPFENRYYVGLFKKFFKIPAKLTPEKAFNILFDA